MMEGELPYFDQILARVASASPADDLVRVLGTRHVHWGCYADPSTGDTSTEGFLSAAEEMTRRLVALAKIGDGQRVLDAGCGFGGTAAHLNERFERIEVTGVNVDARQIARARQLVAPRQGNLVEFVEGDACALAAPERPYDAILAVECIFHFPSRLRFFRGARRALKRGGRLVFSDFVPHGPTLFPATRFTFQHRHEIEGFFGKFRPALPYTSTLYRWLGKLTGFRLVEDVDLTENTMPTYPALTRIMRQIGNQQAARAIELMGVSAGKRWILYRTLAFEAA